MSVPVVDELEARWMACDVDSFEQVLRLLAEDCSLPDLLLEYRQSEPIRLDVCARWIWPDRIGYAGNSG